MAQLYILIILCSSMLQFGSGQTKNRSKWNCEADFKCKLKPVHVRQLAFNLKGMREMKLVKLSQRVATDAEISAKNGISLICDM